MAEQPGHNILRSLQRQWKWQGLLYCLLLALAGSLLATVLLVRWLAFSPWMGLPVFVVFFLLALIFFPYWRISLADTARFLNERVPELEESCGLLLLPRSSLGSLERLQADRTAGRLGLLQQLQGVRSGGTMTPGRAPHPLRKRLFMAAGLLAGACLVTALVWIRGGKIKQLTAPVVAAKPALEMPAPGVGFVNIRITPPAYTGRSIRQQQRLNLHVEEGSRCNWEINTNIPVDSLQFIFNDTLHVALTPGGDAGHRSWHLSAAVSHAGFYQVKTNENLSELYTIEVIHDDAPRIQIKTPKPYTVVDYGESRKITLAVTIQDDYGISDAGVLATIANGSGEAVKFTEQALSFDRSFTGSQASYDLQKTLDLDALGLKPGDELYFYCRAKDNRGQESRSDMYIISLPDTAQLMSLEGLTTGLDIKPEYFRSERQIIIETEQLLREKDTLSVQAFNSRANDLGIDQKLLRLRYGKFLGEEAEEGAATEGFSSAPNAPKDFSNAGKILDAFTDKHDNAEDATYFEPAIKAQLKATLSEMWSAELRLRTFKVQEALPYEYKALRLLKDLQQKSRAFVAKTGVKVTPLDPAKRLTGKLEEIGEPLQRNSLKKDPEPSTWLRMALSVLEAMEKQDVRSPVSAEVLQQALRQLGSQASVHPGDYLVGYQALRRILGVGGMAGNRQGGATSGGQGAAVRGGQVAAGKGLAAGSVSGDIAAAQQAIKKMLPEGETGPAVGRAPSDDGLSEIYFRNLQEPVHKK